jgi:hypothetical protein
METPSKETTGAAFAERGASSAGGRSGFLDIGPEIGDLEVF